MGLLSCLQALKWKLTVHIENIQSMPKPTITYTRDFSMAQHINFLTFLLLPDKLCWPSCDYEMELLWCCTYYIIVNESCVVSVAYFSHFWYIMSDFIVLEIISRKLIEVEVDEGHGLHYLSIFFASVIVNTILYSLTIPRTFYWQ